MNRAAGHRRLGLLLGALALGASPWVAGWCLLAEGRAAVPRSVRLIEVRPVDPPPLVVDGPHLPRGCVLMLRRAKPAPWEVLVRRDVFGDRMIRAVRALGRGTPAWVLRGRGRPLDIAWPLFGLARRPMELLTTAYDPGPQDNSAGWVDTTRLGSRARFGIVAVDPRVIPLGTRLYVEGYGPGLAADVGGAIKGRRMDLCFNSSDQARAWGRRRCRVWIVDTAPRSVRDALRAMLEPRTPKGRML